MGNYGLSSFREWCAHYLNSLADTKPALSFLLLKCHRMVPNLPRSSPSIDSPLTTIPHPKPPSAFPKSPCQLPQANANACAMLQRQDLATVGKHTSMHWPADSHIATDVPYRVLQQFWTRTWNLHWPNQKLGLYSEFRFQDGVDCQANS